MTKAEAKTPPPTITKEDTLIKMVIFGYSLIGHKPIAIVSESAEDSGGVQEGRNMKFLINKLIIDCWLTHYQVSTTS